jgi:hypothetical protein
MQRLYIVKEARILKDTISGVFQILRRGAEEDYRLLGYDSV